MFIEDVSKFRRITITIFSRCLEEWSLNWRRGTEATTGVTRKSVI